jgi:hypothetical protein
MHHHPELTPRLRELRALVLGFSAWLDKHGEDGANIANQALASLYAQELRRARREAAEEAKEVRT